MRVGIDVRIDQTGIGRYSRRLVEALAALDGGIEYVLFARRDRYDSLERLVGAVELRLADIRWYTVAEQVRLPFVLRAARVDLMHFPHFNVPLATTGPYVVTIHDLTHFLRVGLGDDAHMRWWRRLPYRLVLNRAVRRAARVIAVSEATKRALVSQLGVEAGRVEVVHEGVDPGQLGKPDEGALARLGVDAPYFLYVGSAYPHKNLTRLLEAFAQMRGEARGHRLVLAGDLGSYHAGLAARAADLDIASRVTFTGRVADAELAALYREATALVIVSLAEGFGLTGLEAMATGVPVLASHIAALEEVYGDAALFVDPSHIEDVAGGLERLSEDHALRRELRRRGAIRSRQFSWRTTAEATRGIYLDSLVRRR